MKKIMLPLIIGVLFLSFINSQQVDTTNSTISFVFESKNVDGTIGDLQSSSKIDYAAFENSVLQGSVGITTLKTGNFLRNGHLMWKKYFHRKKHPRLSFKSTNISKKDQNTYTINGELNIKGITKEEQFTATIQNNNILVTGSINIADYNILIDKEVEKNTVSIRMNLVLEK